MEMVSTFLGYCMHQCMVGTQFLVVMISGVKASKSKGVLAKDKLIFWFFPSVMVAYVMMLWQGFPRTGHLSHFFSSQEKCQLRNEERRPHHLSRHWGDVAILHRRFTGAQSVSPGSRPCVSVQNHRALWQHSVSATSGVCFDEICNTQQLPLCRVGGVWFVHIAAN